MHSMVTLLALAVAICAGCGSAGPSTAMPSQPMLTDSCATPGATYLESFTQTSGTCGPVPSEIVDISPEGTVVLASSMTCSSANWTNCTLQYNDCTTNVNGVLYTTTSSVTFAIDGGSASGAASVAATGNGIVCASTYNVTAVRQ